MTDIDSNSSPDHLELAQEIRAALHAMVHMLRILDYPGSLSTAQVSVLTTLARESARVGELARLGGVTQPGMSQLISGLEAGGLVTRNSSESDARVTLVQITEEGRQALATVNGERNGVLAPFLDRLEASEIEKVRAGLGPLTRLATDVVHHETADSTGVTSNNMRR